MNTTLARLLWIAAPLIAVAIASAPEWPARAQMMSAPARDWVLPLANEWAAFSRGVEPAPVAPARVMSAVTQTQLPQAAPVVVAIATPATVSVAAVAAVAAPVARQTGGTVLLLGDSLMGEVARGLRQGLPRTFVLVDKHRSSTGLTNSGYYNWPTEAQGFAVENHPRWIVIHLGANDAQDMLVDGRWVRFGSEAWKTQYAARAQAMIDNVKASAPGATLVWLGLPAMRSPAFDAKMSTIAALHQQAALSRGVPYLDGRLALGQQYTKAGPAKDGKNRIWRAEDGIHYSREGGYRLAQEVGEQPSMGWPWASL